MHHNKADIKPAPNKITQLIRKVKNTPIGAPGAIGFAKTIGMVGGILAPVPSIGKIKGVKKIAQAFSGPSGNIKSSAKQVGAIIKLHANMGTFGKTISKASLRTSNKPKLMNQKLQEAFSYPREILNPKLPISKPVNFKGPNPANKIGAGGNSYPK